MSISLVTNTSCHLQVVGEACVPCDMGEFDRGQLADQNIVRKCI